MNRAAFFVSGTHYATVPGGVLDFCKCGMPVELKSENYGLSVKCGRTSCGIEVTQPPDEPRINLVTAWNKLQRRIKKGLN